MTPRTEPNSIPPMFADRQEWRETYAAYVGEFKESGRRRSDELRLKLQLIRLGFIDANLDSEVKYIKDNL